jgi:hypothetical protein
MALKKKYTRYWKMDIKLRILCMKIEENYKYFVDSLEFSKNRSKGEKILRSSGFYFAFGSSTFGAPPPSSSALIVGG